MGTEVPDKEEAVCSSSEGSCSPTLQVTSGVPQGSVLGPLLFVIYLNDVADCISGGSKINLFADDIALYRIIYNPDDYLTLQLM